MNFKSLILTPNVKIVLHSILLMILIKDCHHNLHLRQHHHHHYYRLFSLHYETHKVIVMLREMCHAV